MRTLKKLLLVTMLAVTIAIAMTITGCGQTAGENENGENFSVEPMEVKDEETDAVVAADEVVGTEEGMPAGVWLEGIESRQIDNADILLEIEE